MELPEEIKETISVLCEHYINKGYSMVDGNLVNTKEYVKKTYKVRM